MINPRLGWPSASSVLVALMIGIIALVALGLGVSVKDVFVVALILAAPFIVRARSRDIPKR